MSQTSSGSGPTSTSLGWGYIPGFPGPLTLSNSAIINSILSDIPYLITGLLGFAILTFFLIVRRSNRYVWVGTLAVASEFLAAILDMSQLLQRGGQAVQEGINVSPPMIIAREVMLSIAPGLFFLFFWCFVSLPPRGELQPPYSNRPYSQTLGIVNYPDAYHCGSWNRWGLLGTCLQWIILANVFAVPALQIAWRISAFNIPFDIVYNASVTVEILLSCLFILKINGNVWLSNLGEKWRTFRDYTPVLFCLTIGLGVRVGNVESFKFSDSPLGRFLQAIESYVLFLYILCATFYPQSSESHPPSLNPPLFTDPESGSVRKINPQYRMDDGEPMKKPHSPTILPRSLSRESGSRSDPPVVRPPDPSISSYQVTHDEEISAAPTNASGRLEPGNGQGAKPPVKRTSYLRPPGSPSTPQNKDSNSPTGRFYAISDPESSPVYGLNGIVRASAVPSSINSRVSDLSSLYRRQAELDKSVAGLLRYSRISDPRDTRSPALSDFSLSNFPAPPIVRTSVSSDSEDSGRDELVMDNTTFSLIPPRMPAVGGHERQLSVPVSTQGSEDGLVLGTGRDRFPSNATRYDVTSFIGGYAIPENAPASPLNQSIKELNSRELQSVEGSKGQEGQPGTLYTTVSETTQIRRGQDPPFISPLNPNRPNQARLQLQKFEISRPLQRISIQDAFAYERPRDPPLRSEAKTSAI